MKITLIVAFLFAIFRGGQSAVADGGECTADADCENFSKGRMCVKPFPDCTKGYCLCPFGEFGYEKDGEICKTSDLSNDAACDSVKQTCNTGAGLTCDGTSNKCACKTDTTWTAGDLSCSTGTKGKKLGDTCAAGSICTASKGLTITTCGDGVPCACDTKYKKDGTGCVKRISYLKDDECADVEANTGTAGMLCSTNMVAYTNGGTTEETITTNFECPASKKCACPSAKPTFVKLTDKLSFCKEDSGTKNLTDTCSGHSDCSSTLACGKCPGDAAKKCHKDMQYKDDDSGATVHQITLAAVFVIVGVVQIVKF